MDVTKIEVLVNDKDVGRVTRFLDGIAVEMHAKPVRGARVHGGKITEVGEPGASLPQKVYDALVNKGVPTFTKADIREAVVACGGKETSCKYVSDSLLRQKLVRGPGKGGRNWKLKLPA